MYLHAWAHVSLVGRCTLYLDHGSLGLLQKDTGQAFTLPKSSISHITWPLPPGIFILIATTLINYYLQ